MKTVIIVGTSLATGICVGALALAVAEVVMEMESGKTSELFKVMGNTIRHN